MYWGRESRKTAPEVILEWQGNPSMRGDVALLHLYLCSQRPLVELGQINWSKREPSLIEELERRGYDLSTLKFSIQKKEEALCEQHNE